MQKLDDLHAQLATDASAGAVTLDRRTLASRPILNLFDRLLGTDAVIFDAPQVTREAQAVRIEGRVSVLGLDRCKAVAVFGAVGAELSVILTVQPPPGWSLAQSFPSLVRTPFSRMTLVDVRLTLASHDPAGRERTVLDGLVFAGGAAVGDVVPELGPILGRVATLALEGPIRHARAVASTAIGASETLALDRLNAPNAKLELLFAAPVPVAFDIPGFALSATAVVLEGPNVVFWRPMADVRRGLRARLAIAGEVVEVFCTVSAAGIVSLRASPQDLPLPDLSKLFDHLPDVELRSWLPEGFGDLSGFRITRIDLDFDLAGRAIRRAGFGVTNDAVWTAAGGAVSLARPTVYLAVTDLGTRERQVQCMFGGEVAIGGVQARVEAFGPDFVFTGALPEVSLTQFVATQLPELAGAAGTLPDVGLYRVAFTLAPRTGEISFRAECRGRTVGEDAVWMLPIGITALGVGDLAVEFNRRPAVPGGKARVDGLISGRIQVADAAFEVAYAFPGDFVLRGQLPQIEFAPLLQAIAGAGALRDLPLPPSLLDLSLRDAYVAIAPQQRSFSIAAATPLGEVEIVLQKTSNGAWGCAMGIAPSADWKFSSLAAELAVLDALALDKTTLIVASAADGALQLSTITPSRPDVRLNRDQIGSIPPRPMDVRVQRGLNFFSTISLAGTGADEVLGQASLQVYAAVGPRVSDMALEAKLDGVVKLAETVTMGDIGFLLRPSPASFSVTLMCTVRARVGDDQLTFIGGLEVQPRGASLQGTMKGRWTNAFGVEGLDVENVALDLGLSFAPLLPVVGLAGTVRVGAVTASAAIRVDTRNPAYSMLQVKLNRIYLIDLVAAFAGPELNRGLPEVARILLSEVGMEDVELRVVPVATRIGAIEFEAGLNVAGRLRIQDFSAAAQGRVDPAGGVRIRGIADPIDLAGLFTLTGNDGKSGPMLDFTLVSGEPFSMIVDGRASLLGFTQRAYIRVHERGFEFEVSGPVFGLFQATVKARGGQLGATTGFMLSVRMSNDLLVYLAEQAAQAIRAAADAATAQISAAERTVEAQKRQLGVLDVAIDSARQQVRQRNNAKMTDAIAEVARAEGEVRRLDGVVAQQRAVAEAGRRKAQADLQQAISAVDDAQRKVDALQRQIDEQKNWIETLKRQVANKQRWVDQAGFWDKIGRGIEFAAFSTAKGGEISFAYTKIGGLETARGTAWVGLETARGILRTARDAANNRFDELNLAIQGPLGLQAAANLALTGARQALAGMRSLATDALVDLDPSVSGLITLRGTAGLGLDAAAQTLSTTRKAVGGLADVAVFIAREGLTGLIDIRSAGFECSIVTGHGGAVDLDLTVGFMKQPPQTLRLAFSFHDPLAGARDLARRLSPD